MEILDIALRAIQRSGVLPSFNRDECPEEYEQRACDILTYELIHDMNCDRTLDMSETVITLKPMNNILELCCPEDDGTRYILTLPRDSAWLLEQSNGYFENLSEILTSIGIVEHPPVNGVGEALPLGIWSTDLKFIEVPAGDFTQITNARLNVKYNVPFPVMSVSGVFEAELGYEIEYKHASEFVSAEYKHSEQVFMVEEFTNRTRIRFNPEFADKLVNVVLPVPIQVVNYLDSPKPWTGRIIARPKYQGYLIAELAARTAEEYGVASAERLRVTADKEYNKLVKNYPKKQHTIDLQKRIAQTLHRDSLLNSQGYHGGGYG